MDHDHPTPVPFSCGLQSCSLFENSLDVMVLVRAEDGRILSANPRVQALLGYEPRQLIDRPFSILFPPGPEKSKQDWLDRMRVFGSVFEGQDFRHADGHTAFFDLSSNRIPWENGGEAILLTLRDAGERRLARKRLNDALRLVEKNNEDMLSILDLMGMGILLTDHEERLVFANRRVRELCGSEQDSLQGKRLEETGFFSAEDLQTLRRCSEKPPGERQKTRVQCALHEDRPCHLEVQLLDDPRNDKGRIYLLYDVTEIHSLRRMLGDQWGFRGIMGKSPVMQAVFQQIREVAEVDWTVLIEGETGTGKEMVARAIHETSRRSAMPFVALNCAGLTDSLLTSQLFGHKRGAFTGAVQDHRGLFETANGGTLFLDEIGDIPMNVQTALLRVLQEREIMRLGESQPRPIDVRVLAATNRDLKQAVDQGQFRLDLLYRIRVGRIYLPPLRQRREDIPLLTAYFLNQCCNSTGRDLLEIGPETRQLLREHDWPGNVRELLNAIEYAVMRARGTSILPADLPPEIMEIDSPSLQHSYAQGDGHERLEAALGPGGHSLQAEAQRFARALEQAGGNRSRAAKLLGVSRATFYRRLKEIRSQHPQSLPPEL